MKNFVWVLAVTLSWAGMGCARVEKVVAQEGDLDAPYYSIGVIEVREKAKRLTGARLAAVGAEIATLTRADTVTQSEQYLAALRRKLADIARRKYGAHAVIHVEYWPDPASKGFPEGYIYARGEMVRYQTFALPPSTAKPD